MKMKNGQKVRVDIHCVSQNSSPRHAHGVKQKVIVGQKTGDKKQKKRDMLTHGKHKSAIL